MNFKNYNAWDIGLIKFAVLFATLFLVSVWPEFADWVTVTHWAWFLAIGMMFSIKPLIKTFSK